MAQILLVEYSGLRWGEHAGPSADRVHAVGRRMLVDRQVVETKHRLSLAPPRTAAAAPRCTPRRTPLGIDLSAMISRRLREVSADGLLFPSPRGQWPRRSNCR